MLIKSVSCNIFKTDGPNITPAINAPTTCGKLNFLVINPKSFVLNNINAISNKYLYDILLCSMEAIITFISIYIFSFGINLITNINNRISVRVEESIQNKIRKHNVKSL